MDNIFYWVGLLVSCFTIGWAVTGVLWWLALRAISNSGNLADFVIYTCKRKQPGDEK